MTWIQYSLLRIGEQEIYPFCCLEIFMAVVLRSESRLCKMTASSRMAFMHNCALK
jgi:hypothetical protein